MTNAEATRGRTWPWQTRNGQFSNLRGAAFVAVLFPAATMSFDVIAGNYGMLPVEGLVYWSGVWATAMLLAVLAVTPMRRIFRWNGIVGIRRMIGLSAAGYTVFHVLTYFAMDRWDFSRILDEMSVMSVNIVAAIVSTIGLVVLGATSSDRAIKWMGAARWHAVHGIVYILILLALGYIGLWVGRGLRR